MPPDLDAIRAHAQGGLPPGDAEHYVDVLVAEVERLQAERSGIEAIGIDWMHRSERLRDVLTDLVDFTDRHRLSYDDHSHDCYQEWSLLRDEARGLLDDQENTT
jgi:hypothetical protein